MNSGLFCQPSDKFPLNRMSIVEANTQPSEVSRVFILKRNPLTQKISPVLAFKGNDHLVRIPPVCEQFLLSHGLIAIEDVLNHLESVGEVSTLDPRNTVLSCFNIRIYRRAGNPHGTPGERFRIHQLGDHSSQSFRGIRIPSRVKLQVDRVSCTVAIIGVLGIYPQKMIPLFLSGSLMKLEIIWASQEFI